LSISTVYPNYHRHSFSQSLWRFLAHRTKQCNRTRFRWSASRKSRRCNFLLQSSTE